MAVSNIPFLYVNVTALCCFALLFVTFLAAKKTPEIRAFLLLLGDGTLWLAGAVLMRLRIWPGLTFWYYVSILTLFSFAWLFYMFLLRFTRTSEPFTLGIWTLINVVLLVATATGFILAPPTPQQTAEGTVFLYSINWHIVFPCLFYVAFTTYLVRLTTRIIREQGIHSPGLLLVILGGSVMGIGNVVQVAIPGNTFPYDALAGVFLAGTLFYALYRKRMFRMTLVVSRSLLMLVMSAICVLGGMYIVTPLYSFLVGMLGLSDNGAIMTVSVLFALVLFMTYLLTRRLTDSLFTREERQNRLVKQFSNAVNQSLNSVEIMEKLSACLTQEIAAEQVYVCLLEGNLYRGRYCSSPLSPLAFSIAKDSPQITYLREQESYLIVNEFRSSPLYLSVWEAEKELFERLKIDCVAALKDGKNVIGLVLISAKERERKFTYGEISFLTTVASIASIALKNASLYEKMFREARIDSLTGVYNYKSFVEMLGEQFTACRGDCISLMYVDMDDFRLYNQLYGVAAGDRALQETAGAISRAVGEAGLVYRTSGKVFAVLLPHKDTREAEVMAAEIRSRLAAVDCYDDGRRKSLTVSVGICTAPYAASTGKELMDNADLAVYNAKKKGKDTVLVFRGGGLPKELSERTHAIVDQIQRSGDSDYRNAMSMISALTAAIDAKDHYTFNHSKNVAEYAATLAVGAGLNEGQVRMIYIAGLLHDIGKISVPEDILNKQGKLTPEEYGVMQGHVNNSIEMIRHLPQMDYVIPAAIGHHERWDGKGYPRGIAQEEIPVGARCLAIADVFDAMTTDRPYRRGLPVEYALQQIEGGAGTQFDPTLAPLFVQLVRSQALPVRSQRAQER